MSSLRIIIQACLLTAGFLSSAASAQYSLDSKVELRFDRFYDYQEMSEVLHGLVEAYPDLLTIESIGESVGGRELWLLTLNNAETGPDTAKPAMFIDGNIHGNEVQGAETVLYSIWYLTKSYGEVEKITKLVDSRAFYFLPMANPDGRDIWFSTPGSLRGGIKPTDNDYDGLYDEDGPDDIDGDGQIARMYKEDPRGRYQRDPEDDRFFVRVGREDPPGGWTMLGSEGIDNDGDGQVNEDGPGGYDPNRNWPSDWQPNHIQYGAGDYPFSLPETRAVGEFLLAHPNTAAFQSYHNAGGMILRGPAASYIEYPRSDNRVFEQIQKTGVEMMPFYRAYITREDMYTVHGGEKGWAYEGLGIVGFTNELWTSRRMYGKDERLTAEERTKFRDLLQFEAVYVPYHEVEHPTYGNIVVGGTKKWSGRVPPPWMLEEECHRNFAFTMYHADQMPKTEWGALQVKSIDTGLWEVTIEVTNDRLIPTITEMARQKRIGARDSMLCTTSDEARVVASGTVQSFMPGSKLNAVESKQPWRVWNGSGIGSRSSRLFRFIIEGEGEIQLEYRCQKGGTIRHSVDLAQSGLSAIEDDKSL